MALPAPVQQPGLVHEKREQVELGAIGVSIATQPHAWPLSVAANLLDAYLLREQQLPDLDSVVSSRTVECHCTPNLLSQKVYAPFKINQSTLPSIVLSLAAQKDVKTGLLAEISTIWFSGQTTIFWNFTTNEVKEFSPQSSDAKVTSITSLRPDKRVFSDEVKQLIAVSTTKEIRLYVMNDGSNFFDTELFIPIDGLGIPLIRGTSQGRIFFSTEKTGTAIWEFRYSSKETWFTPKTQRICHGEFGGIFGGLFGPSTSKPDSERVLDFVIDDSTSMLYALTSHSAIHAYEFSAAGTSISLSKNIGSHQIKSVLHLNSPQQSREKIVVATISAVPLEASNYIRLVAVLDSGDRVYFRAVDCRRVGSQLQPAYTQRPPVPNDKAQATGPQQSQTINEPEASDVPAQNSNSMARTQASIDELFANNVQIMQGKTLVLDGRVMYAATADNQVLASTIDDYRIAHQSDMKSPISFVELSGWFKVDGPVLFISRSKQSDLILTPTSLFKIRKRSFGERFESADAPYALAQVYGPMQICCGALQLAAQTSSRVIRENAISSFFRFGGLPMFRRDQMQSGFLGHASIRLSSSFDGLALYIAKLMKPIWAAKILGPKDSPPDSQLLDSIYHDLTHLVELLDQNRSFSEGLSERSSNYPRGDDAALLSQGEHKGLQALGRLAKSCQEGIAFLKLVLTQQNTQHLLSYFDKLHMQQFRNLTFVEFFTTAKNSDVARELVNSLVNHILNKGDSVDAITTVIQDRCSSYCSTGDVLEYKALEYIHHAKQNPKHIDTASLACSVSLIRKAASNIQLETLRDVVRDYVQLKYYTGAVQSTLSVAAEQDPANLAVGYLRKRTNERFSKGSASSDESASKRRLIEDSDAKMGAIPTGPGNAVARPVSESELKFKAKMAVYDIIFTEVLNNCPELAAATSNDPAHAIMLKNPDEIWHFALYDWYLSHNQQDQIALLDTPFVSNYLQLGAAGDLRIAMLLWKWHQRHGDLLAAADVLLDLARGPLVPLLSQRVEFLSRAMGYCQAQPQHTQQAVNMTTMVRAYLGLALLQTDVLSKLGNENEEANKQLNTHLYTVSELFNEWAEPHGLYDICFSIFEFADFRDPLEIRQCWTDLLTKARIQDDSEKVAHHLHVSSIITRLGTRFKASEIIFPVPELVPMLEQYSVDYTRDAPAGWIVDALVNAGIDYDLLHKVYKSVVQNRLLEGEYAKHAEQSRVYLKSLHPESDFKSPQYNRRLAY